MKLELTDQEFRYLLDLVYIGNWVLNSTRGDDRIEEYDQVEGKVFYHCVPQGMPKLVERYRGSLIPSRAFADGGIHDAIEQYEDSDCNVPEAVFPVPGCIACPCLHIPHSGR